MADRFTFRRGWSDIGRCVVYYPPEFYASAKSRFQDITDFSTVDATPTKYEILALQEELWLWDRRVYNVSDGDAVVVVFFNRDQTLAYINIRRNRECGALFYANEQSPEFEKALAYVDHVCFEQVTGPSSGLGERVYQGLEEPQEICVRELIKTRRKRMETHASPKN